MAARFCDLAKSAGLKVGESSEHDDGQGDRGEGHQVPAKPEQHGCDQKEQRYNEHQPLSPSDSTDPVYSLHQAKRDDENPKKEWHRHSDSHPGRRVHQRLRKAAFEDPGGERAEHHECGEGEEKLMFGCGNEQDAHGWKEQPTAYDPAAGCGRRERHRGTVRALATADVLFEASKRYGGCNACEEEAMVH